MLGAALTDHRAGDAVAETAARMNMRLAEASPADIISAALEQVGRARLAIVSSFGTESAVLLHLAASVDPAIPVLFLDTGQLFEETVRYREQLADLLGLEDVRSIRPERAATLEQDPDRFLWSRDPDACCALRKVAPLAKALAGFDGWINGRKRYQGATRTGLSVVECDGARLKFNPLASWGRDELKAYFETHRLPRHPLEALGFLSVGCMPCTSRVGPGEDPRAGRWRGQGKVECGIHAPDYQI